MCMWYIYACVYIHMCIFIYITFYFLHLLQILTYVIFKNVHKAVFTISVCSELYFLFIFCSLFILLMTYINFVFWLIWHSFGKHWTMGKWLDFFPIKCSEILITVSAGFFVCWTVDYLNSSRLFLASSDGSDSMELKFFLMEKTFCKSGIWRIWSTFSSL